MFWVISVYFNIRNTLPKSGTFLLGHSVYTGVPGGIPSRSVSTRIHQLLRDTGSLPSVSVQSERELVRTINTRENILQMIQRSPRLSTRRMTSRIGVSSMQV